MITRSAKIVLSGCSLFLLAIIALAITLPLVLINNNDHLIVVMIPGLNNGTIKALSTLNDPVYDKFFSENIVTLLDDNINNLKHFTTAHNVDMNYLDTILSKNNHVMVITEDTYDGKVPIDMLRKHETVNFPEIIPSVLISGGLEKMDKNTQLIYNESYVDRHSNLGSLFTQDKYPFGGIILSDTFDYKLDTSIQYDSIIEYFTQGKLDIFKRKGISIFDFSKSREALESRDGITYLFEIKFILDLFLKNEVLEKKNILFLPLLTQSQHIQVDDNFNMDMIENVQHSFRYLLDQNKLFSCNMLRESFNLQTLTHCTEGRVLSFEYLYELVRENFGIHLSDHNSLNVFGQGKKVIEIESKIHEFKTLGQDISRIFKFAGNDKKEKVPQNEEIKVYFDKDTRQFLDNPCHFSNALEEVDITITSENKDFVLVNLYCQTNDIEKVIAVFDLSLNLSSTVELTTCDHIFLRVKEDDKDQDSIIISKIENIELTHDIKLGTMVKFEMDDEQCADAFIISRCSSNTFDDDCKPIQIPFIYTEFSTEEIHFEVIGRINKFTYKQETISVSPVEMVSSINYSYPSGFENYVLLEGMMISPADLTNNWEVPVNIRNEDNMTIGVILQYNSNDRDYKILLGIYEFFEEGIYSLKLDTHDYKFEIPKHLDLGTVKTFFNNECHIGGQLSNIEIDIVVDAAVKDDVLFMCNDKVVETWTRDNYDLIKNINLNGCEIIYLKIGKQGISHITSENTIKTVDINLPDEIIFHTPINFEISSDECKASFAFQACSDGHCNEVLNFPHVNEFLNLHDNQYYSIIGVSNEYEYLRLIPTQIDVSIDPTNHITILTDRILLDTLLIEPNTIESYNVQVEHIVDDTLIQTLAGSLIPSYSQLLNIENVANGYELVLKDGNFDNGKYVILLDSTLHIEFDVQLLAFF